MIRRYDGALIVVPKYEVSDLQAALLKAHQLLRTEAETDKERALLLKHADFVWDILAATGYTEF